MAVFVSRANEQSSKEHAAGHLLSKLSSATGGTLEVELCPVLAAAVLGGRGHYLRVDLTEVRQLKTDPARLLHHRLHWINPGQKGSIGMDKLVGYVWPEPANAATQRKRHERVRNALIEMSALGWSFVKSGEVYTIKRPAISVTPTLPHRSH